MAKDLDDCHSYPVSDDIRAGLNQLRDANVVLNRDGLVVDGQPAMYYAEQALFGEHAVQLIRDRPAADVLEIGFGLGVFASEINHRSPKTYTCIELNSSITRLARHLLSPFDHPCQVIEGAWQWNIPTGRRWDIVVFDSLPEPGYEDEEFELFVGHCLPDVLRADGVFGFFHPRELEPARDEFLRTRFASVTRLRHRIADIPPTWSLPSEFVYTFRCSGPL
jgi:spermidine synthase